MICMYGCMDFDMIIVIIVIMLEMHGAWIYENEYGRKI